MPPAPKLLPQLTPGSARRETTGGGRGRRLSQVNSTKGKGTCDGFASTGVLLIKAPLLSLFVPQRIRVCSEHPGQSDLLVLKEFMEAGKLTPVVGRTYPLGRTGEAISFFGEEHAEGKVVITI